MTDDTTRLERIVARARAIGWTTRYTGQLCMTHPKHGKYYFDTGNSDHLTAAERLLSLYEPSSAVDIGHDCDHCGIAKAKCRLVDQVALNAGEIRPGPKCKSGTYKMITWKEATDDQSTRG